MLGEKAVEGKDHVTQLSTQGGSSSTWEEATVDVSNQLPRTLHENGKVDGVEQKVGKKSSSLSVSLPVTHGTQIKLTEAMQWVKEKNHELRKAHPKVNPLSTFPCTNLPSVSEPAESEDDIPPSFEGQHRMGDFVAKDFNTIDGNMGYFENMEHRDLEQVSFVSFPFKTPSGPSLGVTWANPTTDSPKTYSQ